MTQQHLERLSSIDASFLTNETSTSHMHVGAVLVFEGPPPRYDDLVEQVRARLSLVPRFRQKLAVPPLETGRPFWVDDPCFNLTYHVRHTALPSPGSEDELRRLAGRLFSQQLVDLPKTFDRKPAACGEQGRMTPTEEVVMRPPEVFVRPLAHGEAVRLKRMSKQAEHQCTRQRAAILLASNTRMSAPEIAEMWMTDESRVRKVIHEFNQRGLDSLRPNFRGGRPRRITGDDRKRIVAVAGARPTGRGAALTRWSLPRLSHHLAEQGIVAVSPAHLARLLAEAGLAFQRTRSWKASPDPDYETKAARVLALYEAEPEDGPVISFDQMGPISLRPTHGSGWAPSGRPERLRATFNRRHGTRYVFGAYDVHADRLRTRLRPRRRGSDMLVFMRQIRLCYPRRKTIHWIQDNLSANWTPDIREFAAANRIELVPTPTYASYLNRVECHFGPIAEFVVANADYLDWEAFAFALADHVRYRNGPHRDRRLAAAEAKLLVAA